MSALLQPQPPPQQQRSCSPSSALLAHLRHHLHSEIAATGANNVGPVIAHQHPHPNDVLLTLLARNKNLEGTYAFSYPRTLIPLHP